MKNWIQSLAINIIPTNLDTFQKFLLVEIILLLFTLMAILHLIGYFVSLYLIKNTNLENSHYIIKFIINIYKKLHL